MKDSDNELGRQTSSISTSLLELVKLQDPEGWHRLSALYSPLVYRWCLRAGLQPEDAEDVAQEVFRTVSGKIGEFRRSNASDTFRGWLWTITRNKIGDYMRRRRGPEAVGGTGALLQLRNLSDELEDNSSSSDDIGGLYSRAMNLIRIEFEDRSWQAFWRVAIEGQKAADVANDLQMSTNAVYIAKSRIYQRLRDELGDNESLGG